MTTSIKDRTHKLFLALFYSTPVLRQNTAFRVSVGDKSIAVKEPTDAILILLDMFSAGDTDFCFQGELEDQVRRWYGVKTSSSFDKSLAMLDKQGCIAKEPNPSNQRENKLRLTPTGRRLAAKVTSERTRALEPMLLLLENSSPAFRRELPIVLDRMIESSQRDLRGNGARRSRKRKPHQ